MTARKKSIDKTDLAKVDAHVIRPEEYEEVPEFTQAMMRRATMSLAGKPVRRGRPPTGKAKTLVSIRLSPEVVAFFRAKGKGWRTHIDDALRKVVKARKRA